jgi:uncharacterized protein YodC (DUF2158 family)
MMSEISKGMVVQLVSGGPKMSVADMGDYSFNGGPEQGAACVWFDAKNVKFQDVFDIAVLKQYKEPIPQVFSM